MRKTVVCIAALMAAAALMSGCVVPVEKGPEVPAEPEAGSATKVEVSPAPAPSEPVEAPEVEVSRSGDSPSR